VKVKAVVVASTVKIAEMILRMTSPWVGRTEYRAGASTVSTAQDGVTARLLNGSRTKEEIGMAEHGPPWPKQSPASYFPSIEKKYGRSIAEWQRIIADRGLEKHMAIVEYLKSDYDMGHGHASALVGLDARG
jgi:Domain of unknown function (DUF4287)